MNVETQEERKQNILLTRTNPIQKPAETWDEWKERFETTTDPLALKGLLHEGFDVGYRNKSYSDSELFRMNEERAIFYLGMTPSPSSPSIRYPENEIAEKALSVVCSRYFKLHAGAGKKPEISETLTKALLEWLRVSPKCSLGSSMDPALFFTGHRQETVEPLKKTLVWLAKQIISDSHQHPMVGKMFKDIHLLKEEAIKILLYFKSKKELFEVRNRIKAEDLPVIEAWATQEYCHFGYGIVDRIPQSIEEGVCGTSFAAQMYVLLKINIDNRDEVEKKHRRFCPGE